MGNGGRAATTWSRRALLCGAAGTFAGAEGLLDAPHQAMGTAATPFAPGEDRLASLLRLAPGRFSVPNAGTLWLAAFGDLGAQLAALGIPALTAPTDGPPDDWIAANFTLVRSRFTPTRSIDPRWRRAFGTAVFNVERWLDVGRPPAVVTFLQGTFAPAGVAAALTSVQGYQTSERAGIVRFELPPSVTGAPFAWFYPNAAVMTSAALLPDGTFVAAAAPRLLEDVLAVWDGSAGSLAERPDVAPLLRALPTPLVAAYLLEPAAIALPAPDVSDAPPSLATAIAERFAASPTPASSARLLLSGTTAGGPLGDDPDGTPVPWSGPRARWLTALLLPDRATAETAATDIPAKLANGEIGLTTRPWSEYFAGWSATALRGDPVTLVEIDFQPGIWPALWQSLLVNQKATFLT